jgi:hypothetical protein
MTPLEDGLGVALRTNLEAIVTFRQGLGLTTATPLQRAICRVATGEPLEELAEHPHVLEAIGRVDLLWPGQPRELYLLGPSRSGKSIIVSGLALRAVQTVDVSQVSDFDDPPRYSIISIERDKAKAIWTVLSRALRGPYAHLAAREPSDSSMTALVRHPSGRELEIAVAAGKAGGGAVLSRWCVGLALDEATRMHGDERQVNLDDTRSATLDRLLPGAQIVYLGSKWATEGPVYAACEEHGSRPSRRKSVVVVGWDGAQGHKLNPSHYTPQLYAELKETDAPAYEVARNRWQAPPQKLFALSYLQRLARPTAPCDCDAQQRNGFPSRAGPACPHNDSPPHPRQHYLAIIDPATKGNAWALVVLTTREITARVIKSQPSPLDYMRADDRAPPGAHAFERVPMVDQVLGYRDDVALVRQWQGSSVAPLDPDAIWAEIANLLRPYRCNRCVSDEWAAEEHRAIARTHGIYLSPYPSSSLEKAEACQAIGAALSAHEHGHHAHRSLELHPCPALLADLARIERRATLNGVQIHYPLTGDGRHCDVAAALVKGAVQVLQRPDEATIHESPGERQERLERERLEHEQAVDAWDGDDGVVYEELSYD